MAADAAVAGFDLTKTQFHSTRPINRPVLLSSGTMLSRDLNRARKFYEEFLGLEVVQHRTDGLLLRDSSHRRVRPYWCLEVLQRDAIGKPQHLLNHWGLDVLSHEEVDRARELALEHKETYGIKTVLRAQWQHGSYAFYLSDLDDNWWEFETYQDRPISQQPAYDPDSMRSFGKQG